MRQHMQLAPLDTAAAEGALAGIVFPLILVAIPMNFHRAGRATVGALAAPDATLFVDVDKAAIAAVVRLLFRKGCRERPSLQIVQNQAQDVHDFSLIKSDDDTASTVRTSAHLQ